jgi:SAM-dependent methyltransferase
MPPEDARPPQAVVMQMMTAVWTAQTVAAVTALDVPDLIEKHGPLTTRELTGQHGVVADPAFLQRALRACASAGIFTESTDGRFGATALTPALCRGTAGSVREFVELIGGRWWTLFGALPTALRTGRDQTKALFGHEPWEPRSERSTEQFGAAMRSGVEAMRGALRHLDVGAARTVADVGGGFGHLAAALLEEHHDVTAIVLDLPEVIAIAGRHLDALSLDVRQRLTLVAGDMFADVPAADLYVLRRIVHDWDDERAVRILRNCRTRLTDGGRVVCMDNVLPPLGDTGCAGTKFLDMLMMVSLPGRERTETEWRALYGEAGLAVTRIIAVDPRSGASIVEGVRRA